MASILPPRLFSGLIASFLLILNAAALFAPIEARWKPSLVVIFSMLIPEGSMRRSNDDDAQGKEEEASRENADRLLFMAPNRRWLSWNFYFVLLCVSEMRLLFFFFCQLRNSLFFPSSWMHYQFFCVSSRRGKR